MKKQHIVFIFIAVLALAIGAYFFLRKSAEKQYVKKEVKPLNAAFLNVSPAIADSLITNLTLEEKIAQLFIVEVSKNEFLLLKNEYGGVQLTSSEFDKILEVKANIDTTYKIKPYLSVAQSQSLILQDSLTFESYFSATDTTKKLFLNQLYLAQKKLGLNLIEVPRFNIRDSLKKVTQKTYISYAKAYNNRSLNDSILTLSSVNKNDTINSLKAGFHKKIINNGLTIIKTKNENLIDYCINNGEFKGLIFLDKVKDAEFNIKKNFSLNWDALIVKGDATKKINFIKKEIEKGAISKEQLNKKVKRILLSKYWSKQQNSNIDSLHHQQILKQHLSNKFNRESVVVVKNKNAIPVLDLPNNKPFLVEVNRSSSAFKNMVQNYEPIASRNIKINQFKALNYTNYNPLILTLNSLVDSSFISDLKILQTKTKVIIVNYHEQNLEQLSVAENLVHCYSVNDKSSEVAAQIIYGGLTSKGKLIANYGKKLKSGQGVKIEKTRLAFSSPEDVLCHKDSLNKIDFFANQGIRLRAFPGCQIIAVKNGEVIHHKAYGYHTYSRKISTKTTDIYDLASLTKVAATTMAGMKLHEAQKFNLQDSLKDYLPDSLKNYLTYPSTLNNITWQQIFIHKSGLPSGFPIMTYLNYTNKETKRFDRFYCDEYDDTSFNIKVADGFFMERSYEDSIWLTVASTWLDPEKLYKYSDMNFNLLYTMFKGFLDKDETLVEKLPNETDLEYNSFERYLADNIYNPLGMIRTSYLPLRKHGLNEITPTEDEKYWRRQLLHGYVHDPTAALYGGIAGNAGLFSNTTDFVKLFQMLLNKGTYGGKRYFQESTVNLFTSTQPNSHRGLGFNKPVGGGMYGIPEQVSTKTFGHTGYTGNSVWADPENDILYIFISNRSHPVGNNPEIIHLGTRKHIHRAIYQARVNPYLSDN